MARLTKEVAVIETEAAEFPGVVGRPLCEFFPDSEMNNNPSDWWNPNLEMIIGMCRAAGFKKVKAGAGTHSNPPRPSSVNCAGAWGTLSESWVKASA